MHTTSPTSGKSVLRLCVCVRVYMDRSVCERKVQGRPL